MSRWTKDARISDKSESTDAAVFLEDAAEQAERLASDPAVKREAEAAREQLENGWDSDLARDVSLKLRGTKVCGLRTFGSSRPASRSSDLDGQSGGDGQQRDRRLQGLLCQRRGGQMNKHIISAFLDIAILFGPPLLAVFAIMLMLRNW